MTSTTLTRLLPVLLASAAILIPATAYAQEDERKRPHLGDHRFVTNPLTKEPFPRTYFSLGLGVGQATDIKFLPSFEIGEDTIQAVSGDLLFAMLNLEYQHAVKEWLGVFAKVDLVGRLGTGTGAVLSEGATVITGFELGWLFRIMESEKVALSATANVWSNSFTGVDVLEWVQGIVDEEPVELVRDLPSVRAGGGLRFAWAVNELVGVSARSELGLGESIYRRGEDQVSYLLAGAVDIDLNPVTPVPIGIVAGFERNSAPREGNELTDRSNRGLLRVAYTGRDDFVLAIDFRFNQESSIDGAIDDDVRTGSVQLNMRYYF